MPKAWLLCCAAAAFATAAHAQTLSFSDAVARSSADAPNVTANVAAVRAAAHSVTPAGQLPDPQLLLGLQNVPIEGPDRYRLNRDEMTMQAVGVMQDMPNPWKLSARTAAARAERERAEASLSLARLEARLGAARAWINLYYAQSRVVLLERLQREARAAADAGRARLGAGGAVDDAIAAEVEATRIEDRRADANAAVIAARAELRRWVGAEADETLTPDAPAFVVDAAQLHARLGQHPALAAYAAERDLADANLSAARAEGVPDWSWSLMYQHRDPNFGDMASVEVRIGLPLFQPWRQGPIVEARRADQDRVAAEQSASEREYQATLETGLAQYQAAQQSLQRATTTRLPLARQRSEAVRGAFAAGVMTASQFISARRDALETELDVIDLQERLALLGAALTLPYAETGHE